MATVVNQKMFFVRLGARIRELRRKHSYSQEDMISYGFSARHWQQIEAGRPITVSTLLRICAAFEISLEHLVRGQENLRRIAPPVKAIGDAVQPSTYKRT